MLSHVIIINLNRWNWWFFSLLFLHVCISSLSCISRMIPHWIYIWEWVWGKPVLMGFNFLEHLYALICIIYDSLSKTNINRFARFCRSFVKLAKSMWRYTFTIVQDEVKKFLVTCLNAFFYHHECGYSSCRYNTTAPMYGVSLTSGQPVTIVQKFPDLLQQVVFEVCE